MRRRAVIVLGLAVAGAVSLGARPWQLAATTIESRVVASFERATNTRISSVGSASIAFLPTPHISLRDMKLARPDGSVTASVANARAGIKILPLISGRLDYDDLVLTAPQIGIVVPEGSDSPSEWLSPAVDLLSASEGHGRITILDGLVAANGRNGVATALTGKVNLVIARRKAGGAIELAGSLLWRGETTTVEAIWPVVSALSPAYLGIRSPALSLTFDGTRVATGERVLEGKLTVEAASTKAALAWLDAATPLADPLGPLKVTASARLTPGMGNLMQVVTSLGADRLEGALSLDTSGARWSLGGTLAGATLDLGAMMQRTEIGTFFQVDDSARTAVNLDGLTRHNIDLRLSIDLVRTGDTKLTDVAAQFLVKPGRIDLGLLQALAYGGFTKGRFILAQSSTGAEMRLQAGFEKLDLGKLSADLPGMRRFSGSGQGQLVLESAGLSLHDIAHGLAGRLSLTARNGEIGGVALNDLVRRIERQPLSAFREWHGGRSTYDVATLNGTIAGGIFDITESSVTGAGYKLAFSGRSFLPGRQMALNGLLTGGSVRLPFEVTGPIFDPLITPDTQILIQRSGAAGPLLQK